MRIGSLLRPGLAEAALCLLALLVLAGNAIQSYDFWWHLAAGERRLSGIHDDPSWLVQGRVWQQHERMFGRLLTLGHAAGGMRLLAAVKYLLTLLPLVLLWRYCRARSLHPLAAAGAVIYLYALLHTGILLRPQLLTFSLLLAVLWLLERGRHLWWLVPLFWLWAGLHTAVTLGLGVLAVAVVFPPAARVARRRLLLLWLLCTLACMLTPSGPRLLLAAWEAARAGTAQPYLLEWQPPQLTNEIAFAGAVVGALLTFIAADHRRKFDWVLVILAVWLCYLSRRHLPFFGLVTVLPLARDWHFLLRRTVVRRWARRALPYAGWQPRVPPNAALLALGGVVLILAGVLPAVRAGVFPVAAAQALAAQPDDTRIFNTYHFGGYLQRELRWLRTGIDGRVDLFTDTDIACYAAVWGAADGWREYLDRYRIAAVVVEPEAPLAHALAAEPGWRLAAQDAAGVLYLRAGR